MGALLMRPATKPQMQYVEAPSILSKARDFLSVVRNHDFSENESASTKIDENLVFLG